MNAATRTLSRLVGLPCWDPTYHPLTGLWLNFGEPRLSVREPKQSRARSPRVRDLFARRLVQAVGTWRLALTGARWRLEARPGTRAITHASLEGRIDSVIARFAGQVLTRVEVDPTTGITTADFDLGARLTASGSRYEDGELWTLYQPRERCFSLRLPEDGQPEFAAGPCAGSPDWRRLASVNRSGAS